MGRPLSLFVCIVCAENYHVVDHACMQCPRGSYRPAGDNVLGDDTECEGTRRAFAFFGADTVAHGVASVGISRGARSRRPTRLLMPLLMLAALLLFVWSD